MRGILERIKKGVVVTDEEGNIQYCNSAMLQQVGLKREEIVGQSIHMILDDTIPSREDNQKYTAYLKGSGGSREIVQVEIEQEEWEGNKANYYFIEGKSSNLLENILDKMPFSIWVKDQRGKYWYGNQYFLNQLSMEGVTYTREDIIGKRSEELLDQNTLENIRLGIEIVFKSKSNLSYEIDTKKGEKLYARKIHLSPLFIKGIRPKRELVLGIEEDITLVKRLDSILDKELFQKYEDIEQHIHEDIEQYIYEVWQDNEWNRMCELDEIRGVLKEAFMFESLAIGIFTKDRKTCLLTYIPDDKSEKSLKVRIPIDHEWYQGALQNAGGWGIREADEYKSFISAELAQSITNFHQYIGLYPLVFCNQVIGIIAFGVNEMKPHMGRRWDQQISRQLAWLMKSKSVAYGLENQFNSKNEKEQELINFLETAVDLTAIIDHENKILKINEGWEIQLGWTPEEVVGETVDSFIHPEDRLKLKKARKEKVFISQFNNRMLCKKGGYKWFEWHLSYKNSKRLWICTARDISKEKLHEREKEAYKQKRVLDKVKNEFFSNVSHEFRTPINIILASLQLLEGRIATGETMEEDNLNKYMKKIRQNTYRLLKLSNNLIDLTIMDAGFESLRLMNHNIVNIIEETTLSVVAYAENNGIELIFDTEIEEIIMACDMEKVERMMLNLLSNAVKFTPRGGTIEINVFKRAETIIFTVKDTGIGIPGEKCSLIFEPFEQVDTSLRRRCEGTGMGLAIVKSIVDMYQGEIRVDSTVGKGTTFTVALPIYVIENQKSEENLNQTIMSKVERCTVEFSDVYNY